MNKYYKELLDKSKPVRFDEQLDDIIGLFIISDNKLHDSGFRLIHVIAHSHFDPKKEDFKEYYYLGSSYDVIHFGSYYEQAYKMGMNLDIDKHGIIHIFTHGNDWKIKGIHLSDLMISISKGLPIKDRV